MEKILHKIEDTFYENSDLRDKIYIADSFVQSSQKIGSGNGEAKLYLGNDSDQLRAFYGQKGFKIDCFLKKNEVIHFLKDLEPEYKNPQQNYRKALDLPSIFDERLKLVESQSNLIWFTIEEQDQIAPPRIYVNSDNPGYQLLRTLPLPELSYLSFLKLESTEKTIYHARLFTDYTPLGDRIHPVDKPSFNINGDKSQVANLRIGQADFRKRILNSCPYCPITRAADDRILQAAHLKPYSQSNHEEAYDTFNGMCLTPTMHYLYDLGLISFNSNSKLIVSNWISKVTAMKLGILDLKDISIPDFTKRYEYIKYHEENIFKS